MPKVTPELFAVLNDPKATGILIKLYKAALEQLPEIIVHFLPGFSFLAGMTETAKLILMYIPIHPAQGAFIYLQARALNARHILEFGTSYGISTIYLAKAAAENGGKVISMEYLPHKVKAARKNLDDAGLAAYVDILEGDARETLKNNQTSFDLILLDGWPDLVFPVFKLVEPNLKKGAVIIIDDIEGYQPSMQNYLDYVRTRKWLLIDTLLKAVEYTVKL